MTIKKIHNFPDFMDHAVKVCARGHAYVECGVKLKKCPTCRRHGEGEKKMTGRNRGMNR
jgi:hypothetical protein